MRYTRKAKLVFNYLPEMPIKYTNREVIHRMINVYKSVDIKGKVILEPSVLFICTGNENVRAYQKHSAYHCSCIFVQEFFFLDIDAVFISSSIIYCALDKVIIYFIVRQVQIQIT
jgi:hypothetical protein